MSGKTLRDFIGVLFLVFVGIPSLLGLLAYLIGFPNNSIEEGINLIYSGVVPWWVGLAIGAPVVFVAVGYLLTYIDADDAL